MAPPNSAELQKILRDTRTVAVVGASNNPARPSYGVYQYLARFSHYELYPVNPTISDIDGTPVYPSLADLPVVPDMVDVFRRYDDLSSVLADTLALSPHPKYLWLQQGLWHDEVGEQAEAAGLRVVMDRCLKVDYAQLIGR
ncbi:CoA-binding protein [Mycobacterium sp. EPa45]|uniref:CoA-binding protein n=1 Tax=Mycobacterium sp. EPa45 TaxID=1545728 RepID=UPI000641CF46|nr:CoA-binding protein [Mycobacterium sp. EPa45]AKK25630.1 CoA-binding protein [Mycobacterium sp. EPa45]